MGCRGCRPQCWVITAEKAGHQPLHSLALVSPWALPSQRGPRAAAAEGLGQTLLPPWAEQCLSRGWSRRLRQSRAAAWHPLAIRACVGAWDTRPARLAPRLAGQLGAGASCLLRARSGQGAGCTPLSGEQLKNRWKASTEGGKKKVSVKTCLAKRASLARGWGWAPPHFAVVLGPCQAGRHRQGAEAAGKGRAVGSALQARQLPTAGRGTADHRTACSATY